MALIINATLSYPPFLLAGCLLSQAGWPRSPRHFRIVSAVIISMIMQAVSICLLATAPVGAGLPTLLVSSLAWVAVGILIQALSTKGNVASRIKASPLAAGFSRLRSGRWLLLPAFILLLMALLIIPTLGSLETDLLWRFRAYLIALASVAVLGSVYRAKARTVLIGIALVFLISLGMSAIGIYPVAMPFHAASGTLQEGMTSDGPLGNLTGLSKVLATASSLALALDAVVALISVALVGVAAVVLANTTMSRATMRALLALILVLVLLVPGLMLPYAYTVCVGSAEFGAGIGLGALKGSEIVDLAQKGQINNETLSRVRISMESAGKDFAKSRRLLTGLEDLRAFDSVGRMPFVGKYSPALRSLAWAISEATIGLQASGLGAIGVLEGVLMVFQGGALSVDSFEVLGPRIMEEDLDENAVRAGILHIDSSFVQILSGFDFIRSALDNFSQLQPDVFDDRFPEVADGIRELLADLDDLRKGTDIAEVLLGHGGRPIAPATHLLFASYSLADLAPGLIDLRDPENLPDTDQVISNLSGFKDAFQDPTIARVLSENGDVGNGLSFLSEAIGLIEKMLDLVDHAVKVAEDVHRIREKFGSKPVQDLTEMELWEWEKDAQALIIHSQDLERKLAEIEADIEAMIAKAREGRYGYANQLASSSVDMLREVLRYLRSLDALCDLATGITSLIAAARDFKDFFHDFARLEKAIQSSNWESAQRILTEVKTQSTSGKEHLAELLTVLSSAPGDLQLPIGRDDISDIYATVTAINLKIVSLEDRLLTQDGEAALQVITDIHQDYAQLAHKLRLQI